MEFLRTDDNELPWVKYYTGKYTWYGKEIKKKEYLDIVRYKDGVMYIRAEQYWRLPHVESSWKPYGWWR